MATMSCLSYLQVALYFLVCLQFAHNSSQCELQCTKWERVCKKPTYSPQPPYVVCNPSEGPQYPECADDVAKIVKEAKAKGVSVKSFGGQKGQTDLICTEGIPMGISALQFCKMNADKTVTCGAGINLYECAEFLRRNGRALATLSVYGNITLSGAILTGEQGNSLKYDATIASQVVEMTIINSTGVIEVISCPKQLKAFSLSLGLLGIAVEFRLRTVELYKVSAHNYLIRDDILSNGRAVKWAKETDYLSIYWFPTSEEVVVSNRTIVCADTPGNARSNDFLSSIYANFAKIFTKAKETAFSLTSSNCSAANSVGYQILHAIEFFMKSSLVQQVPEMAPIYTEDGSTVVNPAVGYAHLISTPICYGSPQGPNRAACPDSHGDNSITTLDNDFSIKLTDLPALVRIVKDILGKTPGAFPLLGIRITFSAKSDIFLSTSYGRTSAMIEWRMLNRKHIFNEPSGSLAAYQTLIQAIIDKLNGRSHWGKGGLASHSTTSIKKKLEKCARDDFIDVLYASDPKGVFMNKIGKRLTGRTTTTDVNPSTTHCALLGGCYCTKDGDCGSNQVCTSLPGYSYRVCKTKSEEHQYERVLPPLKDLVKYFDVDVPSLAADVLRKC